jgi:hypothetical protein
MRSAPQSRLLVAISWIKLIGSDESLGIPARTFDLCFQNTRKSSRWKPQKRLGLDKKERLFPGPNHAGQEHQEESVSLPIDRPFDVSTENDQLVSQQRVFRQQFSLASGQIGKRAEHQGGRRRFDPTQNPFLEHMQAEADSLLDRGKHTQHK